MWSAAAGPFNMKTPPSVPTELPPAPPLLELPPFPAAPPDPEPPAPPGPEPLLEDPAPLPNPPAPDAPTPVVAVPPAPEGPVVVVLPVPVPAHRDGSSQRGEVAVSEHPYAPTAHKKTWAFSKRFMLGRCGTNPRRSSAGGGQFKNVGS